VCQPVYLHSADYLKEGTMLFKWESTVSKRKQQGSHGAGESKRQSGRQGYPEES
jgi:hypothetical protein